jgi:uncharacterized protein (TIGR00730 family)
MSAMKNVCVFAGSSSGARPEYAAGARDLGRALAASGIGLVYGGAHVGLMGSLANEVLGAGGRVVGVMPESLVAKEVAHKGLTELHVVKTMHERKAMMSDLSDGFVALPGGMGTLDELFEIVTWAQLGMHVKPCGMLNVEGYFDGLLAFIEHSVAERFVRPEHGSMILVGRTAGELLDAMSAYRAPIVEKWIEREQR